MNTQPILPKVRVEKSGNRNKDDLRVMIAGVFLCIFMLFGQTAYQKLYDQFFADRPFISAYVEIFHVQDGLPPLIKYDADPNQNVTGTWIASIYQADGTRLSSRRGIGNYVVRDDEPKLWAWSAWFDNEQSDPPAIPDEPFYICVRYSVEANDSGIDDDTDRFCSNIYDKDNPQHTLTTFLEGEVVR